MAQRLSPGRRIGCSSLLENSADWPREEPQGWITDEQAKAIKEFVLAGGALYAFPSSSHISLYSRVFREVMGGAYIGHPPLRPFRVHVVIFDDPITQDFEDFRVNDKQHYVTYDGPSKKVIL